MSCCFAPCPVSLWGSGENRPRSRFGKCENVTRLWRYELSVFRIVTHFWVGFGTLTSMGQVAGRSSGQFPHAALDAAGLFLVRLGAALLDQHGVRGASVKARAQTRPRKNPSLRRATTPLVADHVVSRIVSRCRAGCGTLSASTGCRAVIGPEPSRHSRCLFNCLRDQLPPTEFIIVESLPIVKHLSVVFISELFNHTTNNGQRFDVHR